MSKAFGSSEGQNGWETDERTKVLLHTLDKVSDMVCLIASDGTIEYANEKFRQAAGIEAGDMGSVFDFDTTLFTREDMKQRLKQVAESNGPVEYQVIRRSAVDGQLHTYKTTAFRMTIREEEKVWFMLKDITELIQSRNEYSELNYLLNTILDNLPVYLFVKDVDDDLRYLYWNKAFVDYSKIPASKVIGRTDFEVFPDYNDAQKFRNDDIELLNTREPLSRHETYEAADGTTRIVQTVKTLVSRDNRGPLLIGVSWDITNMQDIEQELVQERLHAEQSDRLKSRFLANMSHEIRTPLNAIVGFSEIICDAKDDETRTMCSNIIQQNSDVLLRLINDILDLSKIEAGTLEYVRAPMDLNELCQNLYEVHHTRVQEGVTLYFDNDDNVPVPIVEDRNRIIQVVTNLLNNASKFTTAGEIHFGYSIEADHIKVYVSDTGIGIAPDMVDKIFERFVKLNSFTQGTGLGLSICKVIVDTIGGKINVESQEGKGSTFSFTIPRKKDRTHIAKSAATTDKQPTLFNKKMTILIAEDVYSNYMLIKSLVDNRFNLIWAKDGEEAVKLFKQHNPDLILMDIKMPKMDGLEATKLIRSHSRDVPIVALSAYAFEPDKQKAFEAGVNDYVLKPLRRKEFEAALKKYLVME